MFFWRSCSLRWVGGMLTAALWFAGSGCAWCAGEKPVTGEPFASSDLAEKIAKPENKKSKKDVKAGKAGKPASQSGEGSEGKAGRKKGKSDDRMSLPLVKGHDSKGLKIPYFDAEGRLQMSFEIGVAELLDDDHVKMREMRIETFKDTGENEMAIELPSSVLDLNTKVLRGEEGVTVRRSDFELTGRRMEFNTATRQGNLEGDVRMLIYNLSDEDKSQESHTHAPPKSP
jgi:hypothetical protein